MARCYSLYGGMDLTHIFDIDSAVGKNSPNRREDVLLVQYFLSVWMAYEKHTAKILPLILNTPELKINGIYDNATKISIGIFESFHSPNVNNDGRIDPTFSSLKANKMWLLNQLYFFAGGLRGGNPNNALTRIPFPTELHRALFRP